MTNNIDSLCYELSYHDILITDGGWNSIFEAIVTTTPMLVIPFIFDQHFVSEIIKHDHFGIKLDQQTMTVTDICSALTTLLNKDDHYVSHLTKAKSN